ncbi:unnamed protein product [Amoebophrya sp. A120]|nr:unnamed protein product [Amoebophrya sp. A120]|eukprot:GSA120T00006918001.1
MEVGDVDDDRKNEEMNRWKMTAALELHDRVKMVSSSVAPCQQGLGRAQDSSMQLDVGQEIMNKNDNLLTPAGSRGGENNPAATSRSCSRTASSSSPTAFFPRADVSTSSTNPVVVPASRSISSRMIFDAPESRQSRGGRIEESSLSSREDDVPSRGAAGSASSFSCASSLTSSSSTRFIQRVEDGGLITSTRFATASSSSCFSSSSHTEQERQGGTRTRPSVRPVSQRPKSDATLEQLHQQVEGPPVAQEQQGMNCVSLIETRNRSPNALNPCGQLNSSRCATRGCNMLKNSGGTTRRAASISTSTASADGATRSRRPCARMKNTPETCSGWTRPKETSNSATTLPAGTSAVRSLASSSSSSSSSRACACLNKSEVVMNEVSNIKTMVVSDGEVRVPVKEVQEQQNSSLRSRSPRPASAATSSSADLHSTPSSSLGPTASACSRPPVAGTTNTSTSATSQMLPEIEILRVQKVTEQLPSGGGSSSSTSSSSRTCSISSQMFSSSFDGRNHDDARGQRTPSSSVAPCNMLACSTSVVVTTCSSWCRFWFSPSGWRQNCKHKLRRQKLFSSLSAEDKNRDDAAAPTLIGRGLLLSRFHFPFCTRRRNSSSARATSQQQQQDHCCNCERATIKRTTGRGRDDLDERSRKQRQQQQFWRGNCTSASKLQPRHRAVVVKQADEERIRKQTTSTCARELPVDDDRSNQSAPDMIRSCSTTFNGRRLLAESDYTGRDEQRSGKASSSTTTSDGRARLWPLSTTSTSYSTQLVFQREVSQTDMSRGSSPLPLPRGGELQEEQQQLLVPVVRHDRGPLNIKWSPSLCTRRKTRKKISAAMKILNKKFSSSTTWRTTSCWSSSTTVAAKSKNKPPPCFYYVPLLTTTTCLMFFTAVLLLLSTQLRSFPRTSSPSTSPRGRDDDSSSQKLHNNMATFLVAARKVAVGGEEEMISVDDNHYDHPGGTKISSSTSTASSANGPPLGEAGLMSSTHAAGGAGGPGENEKDAQFPGPGDSPAEEDQHKIITAQPSHAVQQQEGLPSPSSSSALELVASAGGGAAAAPTHAHHALRGAGRSPSRGLELLEQQDHSSGIFGPKITTGASQKPPEQAVAVSNDGGVAAVEELWDEATTPNLLASTTLEVDEQPTAAAQRHTRTGNTQEEPVLPASFIAEVDAQEPTATAAVAHEHEERHKLDDEPQPLVSQHATRIGAPARKSGSVVPSPQKNNFLELDEEMMREGEQLQRLHKEENQVAQRTYRMSQELQQQQQLHKLQQLHTIREQIRLRRIEKRKKYRKNQILKLEQQRRTNLAAKKKTSQSTGVGEQEGAMNKQQSIDVPFLDINWDFGGEDWLSDSVGKVLEEAHGIHSDALDALPDHGASDSATWDDADKESWADDIWADLFRDSDSIPDEIKEDDSAKSEFKAAMIVAADELDKDQDIHELFRSQDENGKNVHWDAKAKELTHEKLSLAIAVAAQAAVDDDKGTEGAKTEVKELFENMKSGLRADKDDWSKASQYLAGLKTVNSAFATGGDNLLKSEAAVQIPIALEATRLAAETNTDAAGAVQAVQSSLQSVDFEALAGAAVNGVDEDNGKGGLWQIVHEELSNPAQKAEFIRSMSTIADGYKGNVPGSQLSNVGFLFRVALEGSKQDNIGAPELISHLMSHHDAAHKTFTVPAAGTDQDLVFSISDWMQKSKAEQATDISDLLSKCDAFHTPDDPQATYMDEMKSSIGDWFTKSGNVVAASVHDIQNAALHPHLGNPFQGGGGGPHVDVGDIITEHPGPVAAVLLGAAGAGGWTYANKDKIKDNVKKAVPKGVTKALENVENSVEKAAGRLAGSLRTAADTAFRSQAGSATGATTSSDGGADSLQATTTAGDDNKDRDDDGDDDALGDSTSSSSRQVDTDGSGPTPAAPAKESSSTSTRSTGDAADDDDDDTPTPAPESASARTKKKGKGKAKSKGKAKRQGKGKAKGKGKNNAKNKGKKKKAAASSFEEKQGETNIMEKKNKQGNFRKPT